MSIFNDTTEAFLLMIVSFIGGFSVALVLTIVFLIEPMQGEAIKRGYAEWEIVNKNTGSTKFNWR